MARWFSGSLDLSSPHLFFLCSYVVETFATRTGFQNSYRKTFPLGILGFTDTDFGPLFLLQKSLVDTHPVKPYYVFYNLSLLYIYDDPKSVKH